MGMKLQERAKRRTKYKKYDSERTYHTKKYVVLLLLYCCTTTTTNSGTTVVQTSRDFCELPLLQDSMIILTPLVTLVLGSVPEKQLTAAVLVIGIDYSLAGNL